MVLKQMARQCLPHPVRAVIRATGARLMHQVPLARHAWFTAADAWDRFLGRQHPMVPPRRLIHAVGGDFHGVGAAYLRHFIDWAGLQPHEHVLDVGCGTGRIAAALAGYLDRNGRYDGFDVMADCVAWCQKHITPRHPTFRFHRADLFNTAYNPAGRVLASEYRFPYPDAAFDFVFLTSVLTHLMPADLSNYFAQISRVLVPGGRCLATVFLINEESRALIRAGRSSLPFRPHREHCYTTNQLRPEDAVAFDEPFVFKTMEKHRLRLLGPVRRGAWCGRSSYEEGHDVLILRKM